MNLDYAKMKPGAYLVQGENVKSLSLLDSAGWATGDSSSIGDSASNLAKNVAFMYAAIRERQDQIVQTPFKWTLNGEEIDDAPFGLNAYRLARIEKALVLFNNAYFEKVYGSGSARLGGSRQRAVSLSWLNPATMKPDDSGTVLLSQGYKRYQRTTIDKKTSQENQMHIDTEHLLRFELEDMDELYSTASAARAVRSSAAVIRAIQSLQDLQFDKNNGLPVFLVIIPDRHAAKSEKIAGRFKKLFNNFSAMWGGNNRTVGVPEGVSVEKLSLSPGEMKFTESNREAAETILFGLGVPMSKAFGSANYATKKGENQEFALKMAHRLKWIADVINVDEVFKSQGYRLEVDPDKVNVNLEEEQRKADMVISYTAAGMTLSNALKVVGVRLPDDYEKQDIQVEVESQPLETSDEIGDMKQQIFGYHIETGVVRRNEVRARLGLPAIEGREESYADLISAFEVMQAARTAGLTVDESLQFVDLPEFKRGEPLQVDRRVNEVEGLTDPLEEEIKALRNFNRKGKRNREFKSNILTDEEIKLYSGMVYP